jgi:hypothetical protein
MYTIAVTITGTAPLLQHKFPLATLHGLMDGARRKTGAPNYAQEWLDTMYTSNGNGMLVQPATHIEAALVGAAAGFRIKGGRNKTYRDLMRAYVLVSPDEIPHLRDDMPVPAPGPELALHPTAHLSVNVQRVIVARAAVARARLQISAGWELAFTITVNDDQIQPAVVQTILAEAGRAVGIGDYRPRYGRFAVTRFTAQA